MPPSVRPLFFILLALALANCSRGLRTPSAQPATSKPMTAATAPTAPAAAPTPAPHVKAAAPSAQPVAAAAPSPSPSPSAKQLAAMLPPEPKGVERLPPQAPPQIIEIAVSQTDVSPGDRVFGRVVTSSNVASVQARIGSYSVSLVKVGVGRFELTYTVGPLPWFVRGNFSMQVIARNTRGDTVTRSVPLTVR
ncbi:MAG TPA: hypothetical protein VMU38_11385 [Candidatus Binatia bacterium]|nr:hypothetical protein [Candidatus Binatia bacterium]